MSRRTSGVAVAVNAVIGGRPAAPVGAAAAPGRVGERAIVGPKVVAPLGDAVRLVDREPGDRHLGQEPLERRRRETLGRDVEQAQPALAHRGLRRAPLGGRGERVERRGRDPLAGELVHLVLHERDEGRNHEDRPVQKQGGQLVADRLARAGRHDGEQVPARERRAHDVFLAGAEGLVPEVASERGARIHGRHYAG